MTDFVTNLKIYLLIININHSILKSKYKYIVFILQIPYSETASKTLVFATFDFDRFSKHDQIGEVKLPLNTLDLAQTIEEWKDLTSVEGEQGQVIAT